MSSSSSSNHFAFGDKIIKNDDTLIADEMTSMFKLRDVNQKVEGIYALSFTNDTYDVNAPYCYFLKVNIGSDLHHQKLNPITLISYAPPKPGKEYGASITIYEQEKVVELDPGDGDRMTMFNKFKQLAGDLKVIYQTRFVISPSKVIETIKDQRIQGDWFKFGIKPISQNSTWNLMDVQQTFSMVKGFPWPVSPFYEIFIAETGGDTIYLKLNMIKGDSDNDPNGGLTLVPYQKPTKIGYYSIEINTYDDEIIIENPKDFNKSTALDLRLKFKPKLKKIYWQTFVIEESPNKTEKDYSKLYFSFGGIKIFEGTKLYSGNIKEDFGGNVEEILDEGKFYTLLFINYDTNEVDYLKINWTIDPKTKKLSSENIIPLKRDSSPSKQRFKFVLYEQDSEYKGSTDGIVNISTLSNKVKLSQVYNVNFTVQPPEEITIVDVPSQQTSDFSNFNFFFGQTPVLQDSHIFTNEIVGDFVGPMDKVFIPDKFYSLLFLNSDTQELNYLKINWTIDSKTKQLSSKNIFPLKRPNPPVRQNFQFSIYEQDDEFKGSTDEIKSLPDFFKKIKFRKVYNVNFTIEPPVKIDSDYFKFGDKIIVPGAKFTIEEASQKFSYINIDNLLKDKIFYTFVYINDDTNQIYYFRVNTGKNPEPIDLIPFKRPNPTKTEKFSLRVLEQDVKYVKDANSNIKTLEELIKYVGLKLIYIVNFTISPNESISHCDCSMCKNYV